MKTLMLFKTYATDQFYQQVGDETNHSPDMARCRSFAGTLGRQKEIISEYRTTGTQEGSHSGF
jgi:hypothetical protein